MSKTKSKPRLVENMNELMELCMSHIALNCHQEGSGVPDLSGSSILRKTARAAAYANLIQNTEEREDLARICRCLKRCFTAADSPVSMLANMVEHRQRLSGLCG